MPKGKITRKQHDAADIKFQIIEVLPIAKDHFNEADFSAETIHVNDVPFLTSVSHDMHCGTIGAADNLKCPALKYEIRKVIRSYSVR